MEMEMRAGMMACPYFLKLIYIYCLIRLSRLALRPSLAGC